MAEAQHMEMVSPFYKSMTNNDIYSALKKDILSLKLKPGQMISENEISNVYNVSRTPVKTAFLRLQGEKYIDIIPQKGSFVTLLDMQYIRNFIYMRTVVETEIIRTIMEQGIPAELTERLEQNLEEQRRVVASPELAPLEFYNIDSEFHYAMFESLGRSRLWDIIQDSQVYYTRFRILDTLTTARYNELYREHMQIYSCMRAGDVEGMKRIVDEHLHGNIRILSDKISNEFKHYFINE